MAVDHFEVPHCNSRPMSRNDEPWNFPKANNPGKPYDRLFFRRVLDRIEPVSLEAEQVP
jgi:hypothetical protein